MVNLLQVVRDAVEPSLVREGASYLGASEDAIRSAVGMAIPALLGGLVSQGATPSGAGRLLDLMNSRDIDQAIASSTEGAPRFPGRAEVLARSGGSMLSGIFGDRAAAVTSALGSAGGFGQRSSGGLLALCAPMVLGAVKRFVQTNRLDAGGLSSLLLGQRDVLRASLPENVANAIGLSRIAPGAGLGTSPAGRPSYGVEHAPQVGDGPLRWLPWVGLGLLAFVLLSLITRNARWPAPERERIAAGAARGTAGPSRTISLPDGTSVTAPQGGFIESFAAYLAHPAESPRRFGFDEASFETGSATLTQNGRRQVEMLAATLKAYPTVKIRVDGRGGAPEDASAPAGLGKARADAVKGALVDSGVTGERVATAEGVAAPPAPEAGRAPTHPIDVVVLSR